MKKDFVCQEDYDYRIAPQKKLPKGVTRLIIATVVM